jgi:hypothetical protein
MLQGESKRDYMRDYMRRQRAGEPTRKPKRERGPTPLMVAEVARLFRLQLAGSWKLRDSERKVVAGLDPNNADGTANEAAWNEALRRYRTLRAEQRAERKRKKAERDAPPPPPKCWFCRKPVFAPRRQGIRCRLAARAAGCRARRRGKPNRRAPAAAMCAARPPPGRSTTVASDVLAAAFIARNVLLSLEAQPPPSVLISLS